MSAMNSSAMEIMELEREAFRLIQAEEVDRMVDLLIADDGLLFADRGGIVAGKEAQRAMFKAFLGAGYKLDFEPTAAFVSEAADMAWAHGHYHLTAPDGAEEVGKYVSVWAKLNGAWKNVAEIRNANA